MKIRYVGNDESRDVPYAGGVLVCPRMKWVDVDKAADESGVAPEHLLTVAREIVKQPDWELESVVKATRTRAKNRAAADDTSADEEVATTPSLDDTTTEDEDQ